MVFVAPTRSIYSAPYILLRERHKNDVYDRVLSHSQRGQCARHARSRITHIASDLESAKIKAKSLFDTLNMALHRAQHRADPAGVQSPSDHDEAVSRRTGPYFQDTRGQQGDYRQYKAVGLAAADGYLRAATGDPHLL